MIATFSDFLRHLNDKIQHRYHLGAKFLMTLDESTDNFKFIFAYRDDIDF